MQMQNSLVFRDGCLKIVWNVKLACIESIGSLNLLSVNVHFNIWKYWINYVVYIGNSSYFFLFYFVIACFSEDNRLLFGLIFFPYSRMYRNLVLWQNWTSTPKKTWDFSSKISRQCLKSLVPQIVVWYDEREMFSKISFCDRLDCLVDFVCIGFSLFTTGIQLFFQSLLSHTLCSGLQSFYTANNLSNLWCSKLQQVRTDVFCRWDDIFTQKWNCSSPNNLCESPKSPSPLTPNPSFVWIFYFSWSNHLLVPYVLEKNVGHLSKHQNKANDTDRYRGYFFARYVSQINVYTAKRVFEQRSKL